MGVVPTHQTTNWHLQGVAVPSKDPNYVKPNIRVAQDGIEDEQRQQIKASNYVERAEQDHPSCPHDSTLHEVSSENGSIGNNLGFP